MSINAVSFGQRPYGYDPKKGEFTPEQAKKDFKPGIIDPHAQEKIEKRKKQLVNGIIGIGLIGGTILASVLLTRGKGLDKIKDLYNSVKGEGVVDTLKNVKDNGVDEAADIFEKVRGNGVIDTLKNAYNDVKNFLFKSKKPVSPQAEDFGTINAYNNSPHTAGFGTINTSSKPRKPKQNSRTFNNNNANTETKASGFATITTGSMPRKPAKKGHRMVLK